MRYPRKTPSFSSYAQRILVLLCMMLLVACGSAPSGMPKQATAISQLQTPQLAIAQAKGIAGFHDRFATADEFVLSMKDVPIPPNNFVYQGWLAGDDQHTLVALDTLKVETDGTLVYEWTSPNGENLLSHFSGFQVTLEPWSASKITRPTGQVLFAGHLDTHALANARLLFVRNLQGVDVSAGNAGTPMPAQNHVHASNEKDDSKSDYYGTKNQPQTIIYTAFGTGLKQQTDLAVQHVDNAVNAAAIRALPETRVHLEHVINILEGTKGPRFGDYDGNGRAEDPGDGVGVLGYSNQIAAILSHHPPIDDLSTELQQQMVTIEDQCITLLQDKDHLPTQEQLKNLKALAVKLRDEPVAKLYQAAQETTSFPVNPLP